MADESRRSPNDLHDDGLDAAALALRLEIKSKNESSKTRDRISPEAGCLALLAALATTYAVCLVTEFLLGSDGLWIALVAGLLMGRGARKVAEKLDAKFFQ